MSGAPFRVQVVASLINLGVDPDYVKFNLTSFQSDKTICINDKTSTGQNQMTQIKLDDNFSVNRQTTKADYNLNHPSKSNILCVRGANPSGVGVGQLIQIFDLDNKVKLKDIKISENINFMTWVNNNTLALVTPTKVFHSDLTDSATQFTLAFERIGELANPNSQVISYRVSSEGNWGALCVISAPDQKQINGDIQLVKLDQKIQQPLKGHCCCFGQAKVHDDVHLSDIFAFYERRPDATTAQIVICEISDPPKGGARKYRGRADYPFNPEFPSDYLIYMQISTKYGQLFCLSKSGFLTAYELTTSTLLYNSRITNSSIFIGVQDSKEDGIYAIARNGDVILVQVDRNNLIPFLQTQQQIPNSTQLGFTLAERNSLPGADDMFLVKFNIFMMTGDYFNAAQTAASAPGQLIRNQNTIAKLKSLQGTPLPLLVYFQSLLQKGNLNSLESVELTQLMLKQNKKNSIEQLMNDNKLEYTEQLGDLVAPQDQNLALEIYKKANAGLKVITTLRALGRVAEANQFAQTSGLSIDYTPMIRGTVLTNPQQAVQLGKTMVSTNPQTNVYEIAEIFAQAGKFKEMSVFLVDCMRANKPEDGPWQTKVLEWNIMNQPNIVETIFDLTKWNQFDKLKIASLCEKKQLFQRALENYSDIQDIKRILLNTQDIPSPWLVNFLGNLQPDQALQCMEDLLKHNRQNLQIVVEVATKNYQKFTIVNAIKCFESIESWDGIFMFLGEILHFTEDKDVYFKYLEAAVKCNQLRIVELIIQEKPKCYDPVKVKDFLKGQNLPNPKALIFLCDIHKYIAELTQYLYQNNFLNYIQLYLIQVNPSATPKVLGTLLDLECEEHQIQVILQKVGEKLAPQSYEPLIEEFENRNKLSVLENWLESLQAEGNQIPAIHNALAKIKVDTVISFDQV